MLESSCAQQGIIDAELIQSHAGDLRPVADDEQIRAGTHTHVCRLYMCVWKQKRTHTHTETHTDTHTHRHTQIDRQIDRQTDRQIDGQMDGWMDGSIDRQINR